jgi:hypothetical protein
MQIRKIILLHFNIQVIFKMVIINYNTVQKKINGKTIYMKG